MTWAQEPGALHTKPSVIKRGGHNEPFHEAKIHASVTRACRAVKALEGEAAVIADRVAHQVSAWVATKSEVTARDLRRQALASLAVLHPAAAYAYDIHDTVL